MQPIETINSRYEVVRKLGRGGMGDVWLANDSLLGRPVAMKLVERGQLRRNPDADKLLQDEAKAGGKLLGHAQVVAILDLIESENRLNDGPAIIMEYVDGCDLGDWISVFSPALDEETRLRCDLYICLEVIEAISIAHKMGILHRDIKPSNVMCSKSGGVKVTDFGLARVIEEITRSHTVWNFKTTIYAAPEQFEWAKPTTETDVYQLCATLYELLSGEPANPASNRIEAEQWHRGGTLTPLSQKMPKLQAGIAQMIEKGLSKDPDQRPELWQIFDSISRHIMRPLQLKVDASKCSDETKTAIDSLTDFGISAQKNGQFSTTFPNPTEAMRECVGSVIYGAKCALKPNPGN